MTNYEKYQLCKLIDCCNSIDDFLSNLNCYNRPHIDIETYKIDELKQYLRELSEALERKLEDK